MMSEQAQSLLQDIRDAWVAFNKSPNQKTIAGCVAAMEKFEKLDKMISEDGLYPISWAKV